MAPRVPASNSTKTHKPKKVKLGPRVVLDAERCINCTRCVRFTDEVSKSYQLTIIERGVRNYPMTPPGVRFDDPYSMNVIDLCPVGALTSVDFRFQARIWEMSSTPSIITTNAKGSNCYLWVRDNLVLRITPRANPDVNAFWLADEDRLAYRRFNEDRPAGPEVRKRRWPRAGAVGGGPQACGRDTGRVFRRRGPLSGLRPRYGGG